MLLLATETPLTGIEFTRRLPCGKHEKTRKVGVVLHCSFVNLLLLRPSGCFLLSASYIIN